MKRYDSLDSIRGFASFSVVISHMLITFPIFFSFISLEPSQTFSWESVLTFSPLHLFWAGHEAVILFFILSGFVLSLPYLEGKTIFYRQYIIKRFFRIYIPFIVIIFISIILQFIFRHSIGINGLSVWFNEMWAGTIDFKTLLHLIFMSGEYTHNYDTVVWSLVHEMRISIFFPFIALFIKKNSIFKNFAFLFILLMINFVLPNSLPYKLDGTLYYLIYFVIGAILAKHRNELIRLASWFNSPMKISLFVIALILYNWNWNLGLFIHEKGLIWKLFNYSRIIDMSVAVGTSIIFILVLSSNRLERALSRPIPLFLGKISYSLYLIHPIVLLTLMYSLHDLLNPVLIVVLVPFMSLLLSTLYYKYIELPSMKMGKVIASKFQNDVPNNMIKRDVI
ncbi:hypothetical protein CN527_02530 [Bacillus cereus]|nr:hypothetical protein CN527_02530 [Bacillus cereus]